MPHWAVPVRSSTLLGAALFLTAGCGNNASSAIPPESNRQAESGASEVPQAPSPERSTAVRPELSESDRLIRQLIERACKNGDAKGFVDAFIASAAVRRSYLAPVVFFSEPGVSQPIRIDAADYDRFPLEMFDYYRRPVQPRGEDEYVKIVLDQSQDNRIAVEWIRVRYEGDVGDGDSLGTPYKLDGQPYRADTGSTDGKFLFEPADGCWQLSADIRYAKAAARP